MAGLSPAARGSFARLFAALCLLASTTAGAAGCDWFREPLPRLGRVGEFELVDQRGEPFRARDLEGKVVVMAAMFTSCPSICPQLTAQMGNLQRRVGEDVPLRLLSVTVDPVVDTPDVLAHYAEAHGASGDWVFLTGEQGRVQETLMHAFRAAPGFRREIPGGGYDITHNGSLLLIGPDRELRGMYRTDAEGMRQLEADVRRVAP